MASPIGHILAGLIIDKSISIRKYNVGWIVFFALLPDFDFIFGIIASAPNKYHHGFTHSILFVLLVGLAGGLVVWLIDNRQKFFGNSMVFMTAGLSHLLLDWLAKDTSAPYGVPLLWPFSESYYIASVQIFSDIHRSSNIDEFFFSLLSTHNFLAIGREILILTPFWVIFLLYRNTHQAENH